MSKSSLHEIFPHAGHFNTTLNQWQDDKVAIIAINISITIIAILIIFTTS